MLNADAREYPEAAQLCRERGHRVFSYGRHGASLRVVGHRPNGTGQHIELVMNPSGSCPLIQDIHPVMSLRSRAQRQVEIAFQRRTPPTSHQGAWRCAA